MNVRKSCDSRLQLFMITLGDMVGYNEANATVPGASTSFILMYGDRQDISLLPAAVGKPAEVRMLRWKTKPGTKG